MKHTSLRRDQRGLAVVWALVIVFVVGAAAATTGYLVADRRANDTIAEQADNISRLKKRLQEQESPSPQPQTSAAPGTISGSQPASQSTTLSSANLGISLSVPASWQGKWRYSESGPIGISTASVTFYLIGKDLNYAEVLTIGKIPEGKYADAKAANSPVANPDNLLATAGGNVYVLIFPSSTADFKDFTYADATKQAREQIKASFKTI